MAMLFDHDLERKGFTKDFHPQFVTFNAQVDNEIIGDERENFVMVRKDSEDEFKKFIRVELGDKFTIRIFYHNNADESLNSTGAGFSKDTKVCMSIGAFCCFEDKWKFHKPDCSDGFMGYIKSSNSKPAVVRDFCLVETSGVYWEYIKGSARLINDTGKYPLGDDYGGTEFDNFGLLIGNDKLDGIIPAGKSGYVEFDFETRIDLDNEDCFDKYVTPNVRVIMQNKLSPEEISLVEEIYRDSNEEFHYCGYEKKRHFLVFYRGKCAGYAFAHLNSQRDVLVSSVLIKNEYRKRGLFTNLVKVIRTLFGTSNTSYLSTNTNPGAQYLAEKYKEGLVDADLLMVREVGSCSQDRISLCKVDSKEFDQFFDEIFYDDGDYYSMDERFKVRDSKGCECFFIIDENGNRIGTISCECGNEEAEINSFCICEEYRRKGYGEAAIKEIISYADKNGTKRIYLGVRASNLVALNLYRKFGFEVVRGLYQYRII